MLNKIWGSIRTRLILMFLLISLLLGGSISYFINRQAQDALSSSKLNHLVNISLLKKAELDRWSTGIKDKLAGLAQRPLVRELVGQLVDDELSRDQRSRMENDLLLNHFLPALESEGYFESLTVIRAADGEIVYSTEAGLVGKLRDENGYFKEVLEGTYIDPPMYEIAEGKAVMHGSTPVLGPGGNLVAVLVAHTDLNEFETIIQGKEQDTFSSTQETYLVNQSNLMVTESRFLGSTAHNNFVFSERVERCLAGEDNSGTNLDYRGEEVIGVYKLIPEWNLCLVTEQDLKEALSLSRELSRTTLVIGTLVTTLGVAGGWFFSRSISEPLEKLTRSAEQIREGNLELLLDLGSNDELGRLGQAFNEMAEDLNHSQHIAEQVMAELRELNQSLESRIEDRTRDLKQAQLAALNMMEDAHQARRDAEANEIRFRTLFEDTPISLWEEDLSAIKIYLDQLQKQGVEDLDQYLQDDSDALEKCGQLIEVMEVNQQSLNTFQAETKQELVENVSKLFIPESEEVFRKELVSLYSGNSRFEGEIQYGTLQGERIWANLVVSLPAGAEGDWSRALISILDITEQKRNQQAILEEKEFSEKIINSIPGIFYVFNQEGRFLNWNQSFLDVSEYSPEEMESLHPVALFTGEEQERVASAIGEVFTKGLSSVMARFTSKSGKQHPYFLTGVLTIIEGEPILIGTGVDISERVAAEKALEEKAKDLARSNQDLEHFAYVASHDLQEPLRMVASYLQLLERRYGDVLNAEAREFMDFAVDGATRMKQLINDLLAYSRVGTQGVEFKQTDLNDVVGQVEKILQGKIDEYGAVLTWDSLPTLAVDEGQFTQLYQNLISNAIKFRKQDEPPRIHLGAAKENGQWRLSVEDNGIGMDPQFSDRIFVLFQRLHSKEEYQGTGIGLAVSKRIVERHGGQIWVESAPGEGAKFLFTLRDGKLS